MPTGPPVEVDSNPRAFRNTHGLRRTWEAPGGQDAAEAAQRQRAARVPAEVALAPSNFRCCQVPAGSHHAERRRHLPETRAELLKDTRVAFPMDAWEELKYLVDDSTPE